MKLLPFILIAFAAIIYLFTASPFTLWLDAPRFVSAIATLGVGNPPEPLYVLLAHLFTYIPFGSVIFKIQIFSALTAALTLVMVYFLTLRLLDRVTPFSSLRSKEGKTKKILAGIFATLALAFSYQFWSQSQNIETFILVALLEAVILYILLLVTSRRSVFVGLTLVALIFGLATGTNPVIASVIPAILVMMFSRQKYLTTPGWITWFAVGTLAVLLIHLYIPWRAATGPFLNYWDATNFERTWKLSTGEGLNVYVPELGRINGFTGSPEVFFQSSFNFFKMTVLNFTILLPFIVVGGWYLWKRNKYHFWLLTGPVVFNFIFSGLYYSGNQESWFLISFLIFAVLAGVGFWGLTAAANEIFPDKIYKHYKQSLAPWAKSYNRYAVYLFLLAFVPLLVWFSFLNRREWVVTADYIENLYRPIDNERAILFGSSDLFDSVSFYVHDVPGTPHYKPNVVPVTDNMFYIFDWYRNNLTRTTGVKVPDGSKLKYNSAAEYSEFISEFFEMNISKYKIYVTTPALRNNFLLVYGETDSGSSFTLDKEKFKLVPQGMLYEVVRVGDEKEPDIKNFEYQFASPGFPKKQPFLLERVYKTEMTGLLNEYGYSLQGLGDYLLDQNRVEGVLEIYEKALEFNPKNAEFVSRIGTYYGRTGDHEKATEHFERALKIEPRNTRLLFNLGLAYENTGKIDKAIARFNQVLKLVRPNSFEGKLAKERLDALRPGLPAGDATQSGTLQNLPAGKLPVGANLYQNEALNLAFIYPKTFKVAESGNVVHLSNNLKAKDELSFDITGKKIAEGESIDKLAEGLPFKIEGVELGKQSMSLTGFQAVGKTYGTGEHLTFLILMRRNQWGFAIKVYPGDSNKNQEFSQILGSIRTLR